jgi:hypothetical protein
LPEQFDSFIDGKESRLALLIVECYRHNQAVEQGAGSLDDVQMAIGHWIKAPWIDSDAHATPTR